MKNQDDRMRAIEHPNRNVDRENTGRIEMIEFMSCSMYPYNNKYNLKLDTLDDSLQLLKLMKDL